MKLEEIFVSNDNKDEIGDLNSPIIQEYLKEKGINFSPPVETIAREEEPGDYQASEEVSDLPILPEPQEEPESDESVLEDMGTGV